MPTRNWYRVSFLIRPRQARTKNWTASLFRVHRPKKRTGPYFLPLAVVNPSLLPSHPRNTKMYPVPIFTNFQYRSPQRVSRGAAIATLRPRESEVSERSGERRGGEELQIQGPGADALYSIRARSGGREVALLL